ncbi:MAG: hypothetical protein PHX61_03400 [Alphaproteobacteria bacterium]|nr:hypothetical protein [Alphaproteobacteria bacterium]
MTISAGVLTKQGWIRQSDNLHSDIEDITADVSALSFDHHIPNWHMYFIQDPLVKAHVFPDYVKHHCRMLIVFAVDTVAWGRPHPDLWDRVGFEDREAYLDDMFSIMRGDENLQRDRAMQSVGMAAGLAASSARRLDYEVEIINRLDAAKLANAIKIPETHEIAMVLSLR